MIPPVWLAVGGAILASLAAGAVVLGVRAQRQTARGPRETRWVSLALVNGGILGVCVALGLGVWGLLAWKRTAQTSAMEAEWIRQLADADPRNREKAAEMIGANGWLSGQAALLRALQDPDVDVQSAAARALGALGPAIGPEAIRTLALRLCSDRLEVAASAGEAFAALGADGVVPVLKADLPSVESARRVAAAAGLVAIGAPAATVVGEAVNHANPRIRRAMLIGIGWHALEQGGLWTTALVAINDSDPDVRWTAAWAYLRVRPRFLDVELVDQHLVTIDDALAATLTRWMAATDSADPWERQAAREVARHAGARPIALRRALDAALARTDTARPLVPALRWLEPVDEMAVPRLLKLLWNPDLRDAAIAALQTIGTPSVVERLTSISRSRRAPPDVREACLVALAGIDLPAEPVPAPGPEGED